MTGGRASWDVLEHTGEVRLALHAADWGELLAAAGRALAAVELGGAPAAVNGRVREFELRAGDREALLVDWLNELVFLAESERWVGADFEVLSATPTALRMRARGVEVDQAPARVKAATFHGLSVTDQADGVRAEVVLDV